MRIRLPQCMAGSTGSYTYLLTFCTVTSNSSTSSRENIVNFAFLTCSLHCFFFFAISHCCFAFFSTHLEKDDHMPGQIDSDLDVTCVLTNLQCAHELPCGGRLFSGISWIRSNFQIEFNFHQCSIMIDTALFQTVQQGFCLPHDVNVFWLWEWWLCRYKQLCSGHDTVAINKFPRRTPEIFPFPCFHSVAISFKKGCRSVFFLQRVAPKRSTPPTSPKVEGTPPASKLSTLWWRKGLTLCVTFLSWWTIGVRKYEVFLQCLDSNFFGLQNSDTNFWRDLVLNVVSVRDGQVFSPTSSKIHSVSNESSWKHFCT